MAGNAALLILRLEGVLQSWGEDSKWDTRESASFPTKSGIVGLLGCALGLKRDDPCLRELNEAITVAVRADRPGTRLTDYHTVTGDPLRNAEGKRRSTGNTLISRRQYLQDASFLVVIQAEESWLLRLKAGLDRPKWCLYLGRKSCVPSRPVLDGIVTEYTDLMDAIQRYPAAAGASFPMQYECECEQAKAAAFTRADQYAAAGGRQFMRRRVWRGRIEEKEHVSDEN